MEFRDLLELLYTARDRFSSIQATFQYWYRLDLMNKASNRRAAQQPPGSVSQLFRAVPPWWPKFLKRGHKTQESNVTGEFLVLWRVWLQKPSQWRHETQLMGREASISIIDGDRWWSFYPTSGELHTNVVPQQGGYRKSKIPLSDDLTSIERAINQEWFLDPSFLLANHALKLVGDAVHAGREAIQVQAVPRQGKELVLESFWIEADEYELLVDKERGILLRYSAKLDGQEYAVASAESITFDKPIPKEIFSFTPPPNTLVYVVEG